MFLIKNKNNNKIIDCIDTKSFDLFAFYNINLKHNYPNIPIDNYEIIEENDKSKIKEIQQSTETYIDKDKKYKFIKVEQPINYAAQMDDVSQLQCCIKYLQFQIDELKTKLNG